MIYPAGNINPSLCGLSRRGSLTGVSWLELVDNPWKWVNSKVSLLPYLDLVVDTVNFRPLISPLPEAFDLYVKASNHGLYYYDGTTEFQINLNGFSGDWEALTNNPWLLGPSDIALINERLLTVKYLEVGTPSEIHGQIRLRDGAKPDTANLLDNVLYASGGHIWWWDGATEVQVDSDPATWDTLSGNPWVTSPLPPASFLVSLPSTHRLEFHTAYVGGVNNVPAFQFYANAVPVSSPGMMWFDGSALRFNSGGTVYNLLSPPLLWTSISGNPWNTIALPGGTALQLPDDHLLSVKSALVGGLANTPAFTFLPNSIVTPSSGAMWWTGSALNFRDATTTRNLLDRSWTGITGNPWAYSPGVPISYMSLPIDHVITADFFIGGYHASRPALRMLETLPASPINGDFWHNAGDIFARVSGQSVNVTLFSRLLAIVGTEIGLFPGYTFIAGGGAPSFRLTASPDASASTDGDLWKSSDDGHLKVKDGIIDRNISFPRGDIAAVTIGAISVASPVQNQWYTIPLSVSNFNYGQLSVDLTDEGIEVFYDGVYQVVFSLQFSQVGGAQSDIQFRIAKNDVPGPAVNVVAFFPRADAALSETVSSPFDAADMIHLQFRTTAAALTSMGVSSGGFMQVTTIRHL